MLNVVLVHPEIPPNTGNIGRLCVAAGARLHLVKPLGFRIDDRDLKRAGLDYWEKLDLVVWPDLDAYLASVTPDQVVVTTRPVAQSIALRTKPLEPLLESPSLRAKVCPRLRPRSCVGPSLSWPPYATRTQLLILSRHGVEHVQE